MRPADDSCPFIGKIDRMNRAAPEESRGGPINHLDADYGDPAPTSRSAFDSCSHRLFVEYVCHCPLTHVM